jgi:phage shock protein PspC (stress-responsive transcriptional regulator)
MKRKLTKSRTDYSLQGVCGGIAEYLGWSSFKVRLIFVILTGASSFIPGIVVYAILSFLMPMPGEKD